MNIKSIRAGKRHRQQVGDVRSLAASIDTLGLLHPVVVDANGRLIAGARRLAAVQSLGWRDVPVRVVRSLTDAAQALRAERDENTERKPFLPSEMVNIARALEPLERVEAKARQGTRTDKHPGKLPGSPNGDRRDKLAAIVGVSGRTLDKAREVVEAAEREPRRYGALVAEMDKTGKVNRAFAAFRRLEVASTGGSHADQGVAQRHRRAALLDADVAWILRRGLRAVICDPLYDRASIAQFGELARLSATALQPGGTLAAMCGMFFLPEVLALMTPHLTFRTVVAFLTPNAGHCRLSARKLYSRWKPVVILSKGAPHGWIYDAITSSTDSGRVRHQYEQSEHGFTQLVEMLTEPSELVCDPYLGSGTTAVACAKTGRRFVGCDVDAKAVRLTRARLSLLSRNALRLKQPKGTAIRPRARLA